MGCWAGRGPRAAAGATEGLSVRLASPPAAWVLSGLNDVTSLTFQNIFSLILKGGWPMVWAKSVTFKRPVRDGCRSPQGVAGGRRWAACPEPCVCQTGPEEGESSADPMVHEGARTLTHTQHKEGCWLCEPRGWPASGLLDPGPRNAAKDPGPQGLHSADLSIPVRADCPRGHRMAARSTALRASPFTICRLRREPLPETSRKEGRSSPYTSCPSRTQNLWDMWAVVLRQQVGVVLAGLREGMSEWVPGQQPAVSTTDTAAGWGAATVDFRQWRGACPAGLTAVSLTHCPSSSVPFHRPLPPHV